MVVTVDIPASLATLLPSTAFLIQAGQVVLGLAGACVAVLVVVLVFAVIQQFPYILLILPFIAMAVWPATILPLAISLVGFAILVFSAAGLGQLIGMVTSRLNGWHHRRLNAEKSAS